jgi:putative nucleotidyltransferase with HDIG domain
MLKRIAVRDVRAGMFVDRLEGAWFEHSFWRTRFRVADGDLEKLRAGGVAEVWIDASRGLDVDAPDAASAAGTAPAPVAAAPAAPREVARDSGAPAGCSIQEELARAAGIVRRARSAVVSMFSEARLGRAVDAAGAAELVQQIAESVARNQNALIGIARLKEKDEYTYMHSVAVCALMTALARQLGMDDAAVREAGLAGLLHDIGKAKVPPAILNKPGKLTDAEFDVIKSHPEHGHALLSASGNARDVALDVCLHHHERVDGTGYPHRLPAEKISLYARMGACATCTTRSRRTGRTRRAGTRPSRSHAWPAGPGPISTSACSRPS